MVEQLAPHHNFQFASPRHQQITAVDGMWLFLATEVLFFGGLFFTFLVYRHFHPEAFNAAARETDLTIGTINTVLLLASSATYTWGLIRAEQGRPRVLVWSCAATVALGLAFLALKGLEWSEDFDEHLLPAAGFSPELARHTGSQLFYGFYFAATGLHGVHMIVGIVLVSLVGWRARRGKFDDGWVTPVEVTGLYWSFVDCVWLVLYPLIYLVGRIGPALALPPFAVLIALVALFVMRLRNGPALSQCFAVAAMFWLAVLLGLGAMDPLTRTDYPVAVTRYP